MLRRTTLLHHLVGIISKDTGLTEVGDSREASLTLVTQQLLGGDAQLQHANIHARTQLSGAVDDWCCTLGKQLSKVGGIFKAEQVLAIISHHYTVASTQFAHNFWCAQLCNLLLSGAFLPFSSHFAMKDHPDLMQSGCCCTSTRGARPCLQS